MRIPTLAALLVSLALSAGSLWLSLGMGLIPCPLCFYQRAFAIAVLLVLLIGLPADVRPTWKLSLLGLAPALAGMGVAGWHYSLVASGKMVCPDGLFNAGSPPLQSLIGFVALTLLLLVDVGLGCRAKCDECGRVMISILGAVVVAGALAYACVVAVVPLMPVDPNDKDKVCRKAPPPSNP